MEIPTVVGFCFRSHVLRINVDDTNEDKTSTDREIRQLLEKFEISHFNISFVGREILHMAKCGDPIYSLLLKYVTLGCFAKSSRVMKALTVCHITNQPDLHPLVYMRDTSGTFGRIQAFSRTTDITAIAVKRELQSQCETALRDEANQPITIPCHTWN